MKLWQKIFLCALSLIMAAVGVVSISFLKSSMDMTLEQAVENGFSNYDYWLANIKSLLLEKRLKEDVLVLSEERTQELIKEQFQSVDMNKNPIVIFREDGTVFCKSSAGTENFSGLMEKARGNQGRYYQIRSGEEETYLEMVSEVKLEAGTYAFVMTQDIGDIFALYERQLEKMRMVSLACGVGLAFLLLLLVRVLLRPLQVLNQETKSIARGDYGRQIAVKGSGEFEELSQNMNQMSAAVAENIRMLSDVAENRKRFIANLSHEMKTPLTSISGFAELLKIKKEVDRREVEEYASIISEESGRLKSLSGKLMEWVTLGEMEPDWGEINMRDFLGELGQVLGPAAQKRQIKLAARSQDYRMKGDKELLKSMFYNLADNAMKASVPGGAVSIEGMEVREGFAVRVTDSGIGISPEELNKITEPFYMVDKARSRKEGGAGLGLSLCMEIAKAHGADLLIESVPGKGTTVTVLWRRAGNER